MLEEAKDTIGKAVYIDKSTLPLSHSCWIDWNDEVFSKINTKSKINILEWDEDGDVRIEYKELCGDKAFIWLRPKHLKTSKNAKEEKSKIDIDQAIKLMSEGKGVLGRYEGEDWYDLKTAIEKAFKGVELKESNHIVTLKGGKYSKEDLQEILSKM